jgi:hypothetical protein
MSRLLLASRPPRTAQTRASESPTIRRELRAWSSSIGPSEDRLSRQVPAPDGSAVNWPCDAQHDRQRPLFRYAIQGRDPIRGEAARHVDDMTRHDESGLISFQRHDQAILKGETAK